MRTTILRSFLLSAIVIFAGASVPTYAAGPPRSEQNAIKAENARWADAFKRGDYQAIARLYTEDGTLLQPGGERVTGREAIARYFTNGYAGQPPATVIFSNFEFYGNADVMTEVSDATIRGKDGTVMYAGKQTLIFLKQGEVWKLHRDMWNDNGAPTSGDH